MRLWIRVALAVGISMCAVGLAVVPAAGREARAVGVVRADPTDSAAPTASPPPAPVPVPSGCPREVQFPVVGSMEYAQGPGAGVVQTTEFIDESGFPVYDAQLSVGLTVDNQQPGAAPTLMWSLDGAAWQPVGGLRFIPVDPAVNIQPGWQSGVFWTDLLNPYVDHSLRIWARFGPGVATGTYAIQAVVSTSACSAVGVSPQLWIFYGMSTLPPTRATVPATATKAPAGSRVVAATPTPTPTPASPSARAVLMDADPGSGWGVRRVAAISIGVLLAGVGVRMCAVWWLARRRLP
jgi:hypothetical protein